MDKLFNQLSIWTGCIGGAIITALGGGDKWLFALTVFIVLDYLTGISKAITNKELSSHIGGIGILKKVMIFIVIGISVTLQSLINNALPLRNIVIMFYLSNEGISLLENISYFIPLPQKLKDILLQIRDKSKEIKTNKEI